MKELPVYTEKDVLREKFTTLAVMLLSDTASDFIGGYEDLSELSPNEYGTPSEIDMDNAGFVSPAGDAIMHHAGFGRGHLNLPKGPKDITGAFKRIEEAATSYLDGSEVDGLSHVNAFQAPNGEIRAMLRVLKCSPSGE